MDLGPYSPSGTGTDAPGPVDTPLFSEGSLKRKTSPWQIAEFLFFRKQNSVPISLHSFFFFFSPPFRELNIVEFFFPGRIHKYSKKLLTCSRVDTVMVNYVSVPFAFCFKSLTAWGRATVV